MLLQRRPALAFVELGTKAAALPPALRPADRRRIPNHKLSRSRSCRRAALNNLDHSNPQIVRIPDCRPPQSEKATESYSRLSVNPFDSQKMENALAHDLAKNGLYGLHQSGAVIDHIETFLRLDDVKRATGLGRSTIYDLMAEDPPRFPRPAKIGGAIAKAVAWTATDVWQRQHSLDR